jgi:hypothetical protein
VALTVAVLAAFGAPHRFAPALAILRGAAQLALISFILGGVIAQPLWVAAALLVMFKVASVTAAHRIGWSWRHLALAGASMAGGITVTLVIVFATGALAFDPRYVLAIGGIVIGNAMTISNPSTSVGKRWKGGLPWALHGGSQPWISRAAPSTPLSSLQPTRRRRRVWSRCPVHSSAPSSEGLRLSRLAASKSSCSPRTWLPAPSPRSWSSTSWRLSACGRHPCGEAGGSEIRAAGRAAPQGPSWGEWTLRPGRRNRWEHALRDCVGVLGAFAVRVQLRGRPSRWSSSGQSARPAAIPGQCSAAVDVHAAVLAALRNRIRVL